MLRTQDIGGGIVRRAFKTRRGDELVQLTNGTRLTAEEIQAMPASNRNALIDKRYIEVYPKDPDPAPAKAAKGAKRFIVSHGFGRYSVVEGRALNSDHLSKEEAEAMLGTKKKGSKTKH